MLERSLILAAACTCSVSIAAGDRFEFGASAAAGYDSNPLLVADDGPGSVFTQLAVDAGVRHAFDRRVALFANAVARTRFHEEELGAADTESGELRAGVGVVPPWAAGRFALAAGAHGAFGGSTFVDRATGQVYAVSAAPPLDPETPVSIGERFDSRTWGAFADLRFSQNRRMRWSLDSAWERTSYTEDYALSAGLESLDHESVTFQPGVTIVLNDRATLGLAFTWTDLDYAERPALDAQGFEVPDVAREYRNHELEATLLLQPASRWGLRIGLRGDDRQDAHAGYYDYGSWSSFVALDRTITHRSSVRFYGAWRSLDYERAMLPDDSDTLRATGSSTLLLRFEQGIAEGVRWFADVGTQDHRSTDPVFACDQNWMLTGIQYRR